LYGSGLSGPNDNSEMISVPHLGEDDPDSQSQIARSVLTGIIQPRLEETFEMVRDRLLDCGLSSISGRRVVLTGGASQMNGAREIATRIMSKQVRLGRPTRMPGLAEAAGGAAFSTRAGLAMWAAQRPVEMQNLRADSDIPQLGYGTYGNGSQGFAGLKRWFKENF
ncbi:MAG: cell division protein FtsA, partial [Alphaproteobacteria bacterium]|nr:cell division protein FtsA [Alphaproteobacteria bacterium]